MATNNSASSKAAINALGDLDHATQAQCDAEQARAEDRVAISPESIVLRMKFTYGLENERSPRPMERSETVGILIPGGSTQAEVDAMARSAMERAGPAAFAESINRRWRTMVFDGRPASALSADMRDPQGALWRMPSEEAAFSEIAERARLAGRAVAEALGAYDWRRAEDVPGAASVMQGLEMAFEDMAAMRDANLLRKEIDGSIRPGPSRPGMPL